MSAPVEHPRWCVAGQCTVTPGGEGFHRSEWIEIAHPDREMVWEVALSSREPREGFPRSGQPWIDLVAIYPEYGVDWPATQVELGVKPSEAPVLALALLRLAREARS